MHPSKEIYVREERFDSLRRRLLAAGVCAGARRLRAADDLQKVLAKLDAAVSELPLHFGGLRVRYRDDGPIYDKDVQKGTVYYERKGKSLPDGGAHPRGERQAGAQGLYLCRTACSSSMRQLTNQVTTLSKLSQYES